MIEAFISILIVCTIGAGAFFAAFHVLDLRNSRNTLADEYKRAEAHMRDLEDRVMMMEAQLDAQKPHAHPTGEMSGWSSFDARQRG